MDKRWAASSCVSLGTSTQYIIEVTQPTFTKEHNRHALKFLSSFGTVSSDISSIFSCSVLANPASPETGS